MSSDRRDLEIRISPRQFEDWNVAAASLGLSVQDYVRRAVSDYSPEDRAMLQDLDGQIERFISKYAYLIERAQHLEGILNPNKSSR